MDMSRRRKFVLPVLFVANLALISLLSLTIQTPQSWTGETSFLKIKSIVRLYSRFYAVQERDNASSGEESFRTAVLGLNFGGNFSTMLSYWKFKAFFENDKINTFIQTYTNDCSRRLNAQAPLKILSAIFNGSSSMDAGFGSLVNNALNVYVLAQTADLDRTFQIIESSNYPGYSKLSSFFVDFAVDSDCPVFGEAGDVGQNISMELGLGFRDGSKIVEMSGEPRDAYVRYATRGQTWKNFRAATAALQAREGRNKTFQVKSAFTKALWIPKPYIQRLLFKMWLKLTQNSLGFLAVHIRRSDKITTHEMAEISMERYHSKLTAICDPPTGITETCAKSIFVMHDDPKAYAQLKNMSQNHFSFFELVDLLDDNEFDSVRDHVLMGSRGGDEASWRRHSRELVLSISLLAMADQIVCTFSSNLCRLVALINGDRSVFHSLDLAWSGQ